MEFFHSLIFTLSFVGIGILLSEMLFHTVLQKCDDNLTMGVDIAYQEEKCDNNKGNTSCCHIFIAYREEKYDNKVTLRVVTFSLPIGKKNRTTIKVTLHAVTFSLTIWKKNVTTKLTFCIATFSYLSNFILLSCVVPYHLQHIR